MHCASQMHLLRWNVFLHFKCQCQLEGEFRGCVCYTCISDIYGSGMPELQKAVVCACVFS